MRAVPCFACHTWNITTLWLTPCAPPSDGSLRRPLSRSLLRKPSRYISKSRAVQVIRRASGVSCSFLTKTRLSLNPLCVRSTSAGRSAGKDRPIEKSPHGQKKNAAHGKAKACARSRSDHRSLLLSVLLVHIFFLPRYCGLRSAVRWRVFSTAPPNQKQR